MANDDFDWDSYINFDSFESPFAGCDMQGGEAGEDGHLSDGFPIAPVGTHSEEYVEWKSIGMRNSLEWSSQQQVVQHGSLSAANFAQYHNDGRSDREVGALGAAHDFHLFNHNYAAEGIGEHKNGYLHEGNLTQPGLVAPSASSLNINAFVGPPPENINHKPCPCISCIEIAWFSHPMNWTYHKGMTDDEKYYHCRFPGCQVKLYFLWITGHERRHFCEEGRYVCKEAHCNFTTKRLSDFKRHVGSKHCTSPKKFPCPVLWCNKSGNNGFARKDKLNSHDKAVHGGKSMPGKANQAIKPKVNEGA